MTSASWVIFASDEDEGGVDAAGVAGDGDALEHQVRVKVHQHAVFEGAGLGLVGVDGEVALAAGAVGAGLGEEGPLEAAGEARAAAPAEDGFFDLVGDGVGLHGQGFFEALVAAGIEGIRQYVDEVAALWVGVGASRGFAGCRMGPERFGLDLGWWRRRA